jgi:hypothetical protein
MAGLSPKAIESGSKKPLHLASVWSRIMHRTGLGTTSARQEVSRSAEVSPLVLV